MSRGSRGRPTTPWRSEQGQTIIIIAFAALAMFAIAGLAMDAGRLYVTKAELSRSVDAAALSGVLEFNGTTSGLDNAKVKAKEYFDNNEGGGDTTFIATPDSDKNQLTVDATKTVKLIFLPVLGIHTATVSAHAKAGFGTQAMDIVMVLDATGSMSGSPIDNAKIAANQFKDQLLGTAPEGNVVIGALPFRGCFRSSSPSAANPYAPKSINSGTSYCVNSDSQVTALSYNLTTVESGVSAITAQGGSGTNVCGGLIRGLEVLNGPGNHQDDEKNQQVVILLSDGDNTYNSYSYQSSPLSPHASCIPNTSPSNSDSYTDSNCRAAQTREREIDVKTWELAKEIEADGIEIFVVGFGVCGHDTSNTIYTDAQCDAQIGNSDHDDTADERLDKCIATSSKTKNDHYFWASDASELPSIFGQIAAQLSHRLVE